MRDMYRAGQEGRGVVGSPRPRRAVASQLWYGVWYMYCITALVLHPLACGSFVLSISKLKCIIVFVYCTSYKGKKSAHILYPDHDITKT